MDKINLFCLPFAGGSKYSYNGLVKKCPDNIHVLPIEIPGRGSRFREPLITDIHKIADDIYQQIAGNLSDPYAFYGHSMGSLLAYLLTKRIIAEQSPLPIHLFLSGASAPSVKENRPYRYLLPKEEFIEELRRLGGSPEEILRDENLLDFFEPILRADFQAVETYRHQYQTQPFHIPINVMIGDSEKVTYEDALEWKRETTQNVTIRQFPGSHFFIFDFESEILRIISNALLFKVSI